MERVREPEIMDDDEAAAAYAGADFSSSNQYFVDRLTAEFPSHLGCVLDIGCGPADVPIRIARCLPSSRITAVDASAAMVKLARQGVVDAGLQGRITVVQGRLPGLTLPEKHYDAIISKDMLHHMPDAAVFWRELRRLAKGSTAVCVMDLYRPQSVEQARTIVESVSGDEPEILKKDFYNSLLAAFTLEEIAGQLREAGIELAIEKVSERHFLAAGIIG